VYQTVLKRRKVSWIRTSSSFSSVLIWRMSHFYFIFVDTMRRRLKSGILVFRSIPGHRAQDIQLLAEYFTLFARHPCMFRHPRSGRVVVSTFAGENCHFGKGCLDDGWSYLKQELSVITPVRLFSGF
jgi:hypothetical protein